MVCIFICFIITVYWKKYNVCAITSNNLKNNTRCASIDSRKLGNVGFWLNGYVAFLSLSETHTVYFLEMLRKYSQICPMLILNLYTKIMFQKLFKNMCVCVNCVCMCI